MWSLLLVIRCFYVCSSAQRWASRLPPPSKLGPRYFGPYQVIERLGTVAYRLQLPPKVRIHDVFHVALLKKYEGDLPASIMPLPAILHCRVVPTPSQVVRTRLNRGSWELLVQWT